MKTCTRVHFEVNQCEIRAISIGKVCGRILYNHTRSKWQNNKSAPQIVSMQKNIRTMLYRTTLRCREESATVYHAISRKYHVYDERFLMDALLFFMWRIRQV